MNINEKTRKALLRFQQNEITESLLYTQLAAIEKDPSNKEVLLQIANDEKGHYTILKKYTGQEISPNKLRVTKYYWLARILGITFAIKLMEGSEESAKNDYASYDEYPDLQQIARDEDEHEHHHHHDHHHEGEDCGHACNACGSEEKCKDENLALLTYMLQHNEHHAAELDEMADKLEKAGMADAAKQIREGVSDFQKGNMRLSLALTLVKEHLKEVK